MYLKSLEEDQGGVWIKHKMYLIKNILELQFVHIMTKLYLCNKM